MEQQFTPIEEKYFFYKVPLAEEEDRKTKVFFIYDNRDTQTRFVEDSLYEHIKERTQSLELITTGLQDYMSHFAIKSQKQPQMRQLFEGYDLFCSEKTNDYFAQQFSLFCNKNFGDGYKKKLGENLSSMFRSYVITMILENIINKIIEQNYLNHDIILVIMMKALKTTQEFSYKISDQAKSKILFIDTGNLSSIQAQPFASQLFNSYSTKPSTFYSFDQIMHKKLERNPENFSKFFEVVTEKINQQLQFTKQLRASKELQQFPWSKPTTIVDCGSVVISKIDYRKIKTILPNHFIEKIQNIDAEQICNVFSSWVNEIINQKSLEKIPEKDVENLIKFLESFQNNQYKNFGKDEEFEIVGKKLTVKQRLIEKQRKQIKNQIQLLIKSLKDLSSLKIEDELTEDELLERQKIGTVVGKFHERALRMQGLDVQSFLQIKDKFLEKLKEIRSEINPESDEERSIITLENFKDIILQDDIFDAIKLIKNQYNLISSFPLTGLGVRLHRTDGSMINPYLVKVIDIATVNQYIDTISIQNTPDKELILNAGYYLDTEDNQVAIKENIDAVVPLFGPKDYDLKPLLQSKFFHVLMTFNVMHNADTVNTEAYFALLANTLIYLLNEEKTGFINDLLDKIYHSVNIVYSDSKFFKEFCKMLVTNPRLAMVTYHESHPTQCQGPSKALLVLFYLVKKSELIDKTLIKEILEAIMQEIVARGIKDTSKIISHFDVIGFNKSQFKELVGHFINTFQKRVLEFPTKRQMMIEVEKSLREEEAFKIDRSCRFTLNKEKFKYLSFGKYNFFVCLKNVCEYFLPGERFKGELLWFWLHHISKNSTPMVTEILKVYRSFKTLKIKQFLQVKLDKVLKICKEKLSLKFEAEMIRLHLEILPTSRDRLLGLIEDGEHVRISFNNVSNLTKSYCLCRLCPFYLKRMPNLSEHIVDVNCYIPAFNKTIKIMKKQDPIDVLEAIKDGVYLNQDREKEYILAQNRLNSNHIATLIQNYEDEILKTIQISQDIYKTLK